MVLGMMIVVIKNMKSVLFYNPALTIKYELCIHIQPGSGG